MTHDLRFGDCLDVLRTLPDCSVDAVVTDPPYGLSFMGKRWDYDVPSEDVWRECLRVLKPGGHLLAFAGTRTQHRMAVRIEDAGFEIRDMIAWAYGSGFPKSLDVSKAIDKLDAAEARLSRRYRFTEWMVQACPLTPRQMDEVCSTNTMGRHWTDVLPNGKQPDVPTREHFEKLRHHITAEVPGWVEQMVDERTIESENFKRREVVGTEFGKDTTKQRPGVPLQDSSAKREYSITTAHTPEARQWQGWGTALKPALEPITVARKPLVGTVAENVLAHGTGAINVDGCRVEVDPADPVHTATYHAKPSVAYGKFASKENGEARSMAPPDAGRWPANLIHDGSDEVVGLFPQAPGQQRATGKRTQGALYNAVNDGEEGVEPRDNGGSAARFFYCAKASKRDRDEGLDGFEAKHREAKFRSIQDARPHTGEGYEYHREPRRNTHPTVKPTDLMRYLCRLVTPPGGVVLDPFMGSGSTGKAANLEGFRFIGVERDRDYMLIAEARVGVKSDMPDWLR